MKTSPLYGLAALWRAKPLTSNDADSATRADASILFTTEVTEAASLDQLATKLNDIHTRQLEAGRLPLPPALHALAYTYLNDSLDSPEADMEVALYLFSTLEDCAAFCTKSGAEPLVFCGSGAEPRR